MNDLTLDEILVLAGEKVEQKLHQEEAKEAEYLNLVDFVKQKMTDEVRSHYPEQIREWVRMVVFREFNKCCFEALFLLDLPAGYLPVGTIVKALPIWSEQDEFGFPEEFRLCKEVGNWDMPFDVFRKDVRETYKDPRPGVVIIVGRLDDLVEAVAIAKMKYTDSEGV